MTLKDDGRVSNKDKKKIHRKYRPIKCEADNCNELIDIDLCILNEDFDYCDNTKSSIYVYCPVCALQHKVKLNK